MCCCGMGTLLPKSSPKKTSIKWLPKFKEFTLFPDLPIEVRAMIWQLSLEGRVVELLFSAQHGFYTEVWTPAALRTSQDSRNAVIKSYPASFGQAFFKPQIRFNFSLDALFFGSQMNKEVHHFFGVLSEVELSHIRSIAVDNDIAIDEEFTDVGPTDYFEFFGNNLKSMVGLKKLRLVFLAEHYISNVPMGLGPIKLYRRLPNKLKDYWHVTCKDVGADAESLVEEDLDRDIGPPLMDTALEHLDFPAERQVVWGWRPTTTS